LNTVVTVNDIMLTPLLHMKHGRICLVEGVTDVLVIEANAGYIPKRNFEEMFNELGVFAKERSVKRIIFDKSRLTVFHQPSMEWYFTVWKEWMYDCGVKVHRKILPPDKVFIESARIARLKLEEKYPNAKFNLMDIKYSQSIQEALYD
jgi:hypothetical protein